MSLLKEFANAQTAQSTQTALKTSDGSDAGKGDVVKTSDVSFSLMRNTINNSGSVTGSDINDYLERAHELNDEIESVGFAIETDNNDIIKIYVNAAQADEFEQEMAKLLGMDDDTESAINTLAQKFDVIDVEWPEDLETEAPVDGEPAIDDDISSFLDADSSEIPAGDEEDKKTPLLKAIADTEESEEEEELDADGKPIEKKKKAADDADEEELDADEEDADEEELDADGKPVKKKKKADSAEITEEGLDESLASDVQSHVETTQKERQNKQGMYYINCLVTGGVTGRRESKYKRDGEVEYFSKEAAHQEAARLNKSANHIMARASFTYTPVLIETQDNNMTSLGTKFLERLQEAAVDKKQSKLDTPWNGLHNRLKRPYEKRIVEFFSLLGVPGRYAANADGIEDSIIAAANILRRAGRKQTLFNQLFDKLGGGATTVVEAKKRGGRFQKILESIMVAFGFPAYLVTTEGSSPLGSILSRASFRIEADDTLKGTVLALARAMGIGGAELNEEELNEDFESGPDAYAEAVVALVMELGIPEKNLQYQRSVLIKALRDKKQLLGNRSMLAQRMAALTELVKKNTRQAGGQVPAVQENLLEAFAPLEAMIDTDAKLHNLEEPNAGPCMSATYEGSGTHEETMLFLGCDPTAPDHKSLAVTISGPWDGSVHNKFFPDTKEGYKAAVEYANILRTVTLKSGGRPKGWKE